MKTVAILGNASATRDLCPFEDLSVDIWAMTLHAFTAKRRTAVLEMHDDVFTSDRWDKYENAEKYKNWLRWNKTVPVYMHTPHPQIQKSTRYPIEEVSQTFRLYKGGDKLTRFFGGTASYGIALALLMGYERIELYGVELAHSHEEYWRERDAVFYWMGRAAEKGVEIYIPEQSTLYADMYYPKE